MTIFQIHNQCEARYTSQTTLYAQKYQFFSQDMVTFIHTYILTFIHTYTYTHTYIPEDITTGNIEGTLIAQNPDLNLKAGDIMPNLVMKQRNTLRTW
jgi:hypothetical protein